MRNYLALVKNYPQFLSTLTSTVIKPYLDSTINCFSLARNPHDPRCIVFVLKLGECEFSFSGMDQQVFGTHSIPRNLIPGKIEQFFVFNWHIFKSPI